jgi:inner membrane protein
LKIDPALVQWNDAYMVFGITDVRGISDSLLFTVGGKGVETEPSNNIGLGVRTSTASLYPDNTYAETVEQELSKKGITGQLDWQSEADFNGNVRIRVNLKGSRRLDFIPAGKTTEVQMAGDWKDPSFDGEFIPLERNISEAGFTATWKVLHFNRPFSQQWNEDNITLSQANFGVNLLVPVDQYQKSTRTAKYGILIILLTFIALFLVEITQKTRIHPFQYILIGAALTIYYTLLLSLSEHLGYNIAYLISSLATVILVSLYSKTFLPDVKLTILLAMLMVVFYGFIFIIILQQDFSLLIGSIGLFVIIAMLMYFSRKIAWYSK